jgi:hypothetical protein
VHNLSLVRLLDEARLGDARLEEDRRRFLVDVAAESATFIGTLVDMAESGVSVTVRTRAGRVHVGAIGLVGGDFAVLEGGAGQLWCRFDAMVSIRVSVGSPPASGVRVGLDLRLIDALALIVDDGPRIAVDSPVGESVAGQLVAVGTDVVTLRLDGGDVLYVPSASVDAVLRSG